MDGFHRAHAAALDEPLTPELRAKWEKLPPAGVQAPADATTRGEWIHAVYEKWLRL